MTGMIFGIIAMIAGLVLVTMSKMWGLLVLLGGLVLVAVRYVTMMRGRGYDPNQGTINGLAGQGKQQPDAVKAPQNDCGEQSADIWDQVESK